MNDLFYFEPASWELLLDSLKPGSVLSAMRLLSALEPEDDSTVCDVLEALIKKGVRLDVSMLPQDYGSGELETRLRFEEKLPKDASMLHKLQAGDPLGVYLEELAMMPAQGDTAVLLDRLAAGDDSAPTMLLNLHLHKTIEIGAQYTGYGVLLMDLIQEAGLGLWRCVLQYKAGDFEEQAQWWIHQSVCGLVFRQARESGVLRNVQKNMEAYQKADKQLLVELGRNATMEEIALALGVTPQQADLIRDMLLNASAMQKTREIPQQQEAEDAQAVEDTAYFQSRQRVNEMLSTLTQTEAKILSLRFGLEGGAPMTAEAVGQKLGMLAEEIVATEAMALNKLRSE